MDLSNFSFDAWLRDSQDTQDYSVNVHIATNPAWKCPVRLISVRNSGAWKPGGLDPRANQSRISTRNRNLATEAFAFFESHILPEIAPLLNPAAWLDLSRPARPDLARRGGWQLWTLGERQSWIHPELEPDKIRQAVDIGASTLD